MLLSANNKTEFDFWKKAHLLVLNTKHFLLRLKNGLVQHIKYKIIP